MSISVNFRSSAYASETGRVPILLITFDHADMDVPIRISTDPTQRVLETDEIIAYGTISRGDTFTFLPVSFKLPDDTDTGPGNMQIELDNVDRALIETIRTIQSPISVKVEIVMDNALDTVDITWPEYLLTGITYDATTITGTMSLENLMREPFPGVSFTPNTAPGVFV